MTSVLKVPRVVSYLTELKGCNICYLIMFIQRSDIRDWVLGPKDYKLLKFCDSAEIINNFLGMILTVSVLKGLEF